MKKPTKKQIQDEINKLENIKPTTRMFSVFGDNHHNSIDAQIKTLRENMSEQDIYDEWEALCCDNEMDYAKNRSLIDGALAARDWLDGKTNILSDEWLSLQENANRNQSQ